MDLRYTSIQKHIAFSCIIALLISFGCVSIRELYKANQGFLCLELLVRFRGSSLTRAKFNCCKIFWFYCRSSPFSAFFFQFSYPTIPLLDSIQSCWTAVMLRPFCCVISFRSSAVWLGCEIMSLLLESHFAQVLYGFVVKSCHFYSSLHRFILQLGSISDEHEH